MSPPSPPVLPAHHANSTCSSFRNPWPSSLPPTWSELLSAPFPLSLTSSSLHTHAHARQLKVVSPAWLTDKGKEREVGEGGVEVTWLGHASSFLRISLPSSSERTVNVLLDPIFSFRAGPQPGGVSVGPSRRLESPCQVGELPRVDLVCISHNHYDHLDLESVVEVHKCFPEARFYVPLGIKSWFGQTGIPMDLVEEMDWWESTPFDLAGTSEGATGENRGGLRVTCVPAQHNSGRGVNDQCSTLWCGWVLEVMRASKDAEEEERTGSIYFAGDTGYRRYAGSEVVCPIFAELKDKFGSFDLALIPIWRGGTLGFLSWAGLRLSHESIPSSFHGSPSDAVAIHLAINSRNTLGIHFGTFVGSESESFEAIIELKDACVEKGVGELGGVDEGNGRMGVRDVGETCWVGLSGDRAEEEGDGGAVE